MEHWVRMIGESTGLPRPRGYTVPWDRVEEELGFALPQDYKEFVYWFGPGAFDDETFIVNVPGVENSGIDLVSAARMYQEIHQKYITPERVARGWTYPVPPSPGSLLCWGVTTNGAGFHWETSGDPDDWNVVVEDSEFFQCFEYPGPIKEFLPRFLCNEIDFAQEFEDGPPVLFEPWTGSVEQGDEFESGKLEAYGFFDPPE